MSMMQCRDCEAWIDVKAHPDALVEIPEAKRIAETICLCDNCKERRYEADERAELRAEIARLNR